MKTAVRSRKSGFTLVEIMIVVGIIGMVAAVAVPSFMKSRNESRIARMMNDLRTVYDAFNMYAMEYGDYPGGMVGPVTPMQVAEYLDGTKWDEPTAMGGTWIYYKYLGGGTHLILVDDFNFFGGTRPMAAASHWLKLDQKLDDGNLSSGRFRMVGSQMQYSVDDVEWTHN